MTDAERVFAIERLAYEQCHRDGECEVEPLDESNISEGDDNGCYVQAWVWVDFKGTELDKEVDDD